MDEMPEIKRILYTDVEAMFHSDPAVTSYSRILQQKAQSMPLTDGAGI